MTQDTNSRHANCWMAITILAVGFIGQHVSAVENATPSPIDQLRAQAAQAEIKGDATARAEILAKLTQIDPATKHAHWQLGKIQVDGNWHSVETLQQAAASDPRQREYLALRGSSGVTPESQLSLARWCKKKGLLEEARFHWMCVLAIDPSFEEAQSALNVRYYNGQLLTPEAIERAKIKLRANEGSARAWINRVAKWEASLEGDLTARTAALREVTLLDTYAGIPAMERVTLYGKIGNELEFVRRRQLSMAFLDALERMSNPPAIQSMVHHAVLSPSETVRNSAIHRLKERPTHDYVPYLLDALAMPIESKFYVMRVPDGSVQYGHELYRQGAFADWCLNGTHNFVQQDLKGRVYASSRDRGFSMRDVGPVAKTDAELERDSLYQSYFAARNMSNYADRLERQLNAYNAAVASANARVYPILVATTGKDYGNLASDWWDWWRDYTEYDSSLPTPVHSYYFRESSIYYHRPSEHIQLSCFVKGTPVWTKGGLRPIESIQNGDLVLSKNVDSGELAFKPVLAATTRPQSSIINLEIGGKNHIGATRGHPFWVNGQGWRMAKQLASGSVVHGIKEPLRLTVAVEQTEKAEAHNLIVADFNTYFVGETGVLVHDNTPLQPTAAIVPGFAKLD